MSTPGVRLAPLVEPVDDLDRAQLVRYARHLTLPDFGIDAQRRLAAARVLVIGAGGLGAPALLYLAAAGVGTIAVIDDDVVEESNLHRQVIHGQSDIGRPKVDSARDSILEVNPHVTVETHPVRLTRDNAVDLFTDHHLVMDGTDNFATRYLVADAAELADRPYVWGSILRFQGQVSVFWASHGPTYRDLFPEPPAPGTVPSCAEGGVLGVLPAAIGTMMATEAIKLLTGIGEPLLGRLVVHDALAMTYDTLQVQPDPERVPVRELTDYERLCGLPGTGAGATSGDLTSGDLTQEDQMTSEIDPRQLQTWLTEREEGRRDFVLVDVREPFEREINNIDGSVPIPMAEFSTDEAYAKLDPDTAVVLYCKAGGRSGRCLEAMHARGRTDAVHLAGGVDAWVAQIEPEQQSY